MNQLDLYNQCFEKTFQTKDVKDLRYKESPFWDSVGHIALIAELEDAFDISLEPEDMMSLSSYAKGMDILRNYGINL